MAPNLEADLAYRYETRPRTAPIQRDAFEPPESFVNFWDMNPRIHGGRFIRWTGDRWVAHRSDPIDESGEEATVRWERYTIEPDDIWVDPDNPMTDFTDRMKSVLRALGDGHHLPDADPFLGDVTHYVGARDFQPIRYADAGTVVPATEYWDEARERGIEPDAERGWIHER